jgi:hypothetical protein
MAFQRFASAHHHKISQDYIEIEIQARVGAGEGTAVSGQGMSKPQVVSVIRTGIKMGRRPAD